MNIYIALFIEITQLYICKYNIKDLESIDFIITITCLQRVKLMTLHSDRVTELQNYLRNLSTTCIVMV